MDPTSPASARTRYSQSRRYPQQASNPTSHPLRHRDHNSPNTFTRHRHDRSPQRPSTRAGNAGAPLYIDTDLVSRKRDRAQSHVAALTVPSPSLQSTPLQTRSRWNIDGYRVSSTASAHQAQFQEPDRSTGLQCSMMDAELEFDTVPDSRQLHSPSNTDTCQDRVSSHPHGSSNTSTGQSGWGSAALNLVGGVAGKVWSFCNFSLFSGFRAGGGPSYHVSNPNSPIRMDSDTAPTFTRSGLGWADSLPGAFPEPELEKLSPSPPPMKRQHTDLPENWTVPTPEQSSIPRFRLGGRKSGLYSGRYQSPSSKPLPALPPMEIDSNISSNSPLHFPNADAPVPGHMKPQSYRQAQSRLRSSTFHHNSPSATAPSLPVASSHTRNATATTLSTGQYSTHSPSSSPLRLGPTPTPKRTTASYADVRAPQTNPMVVPPFGSGRKPTFHSPSRSLRLSPSRTTGRQPNPRPGTARAFQSIGRGGGLRRTTTDEGPWPGDVDTSDLAGFNFPSGSSTLPFHNGNPTASTASHASTSLASYRSPSNGRSTTAKATYGLFPPTSSSSSFKLSSTSSSTSTSESAFSIFPTDTMSTPTMTTTTTTTTASRPSGFPSTSVSSISPKALKYISSQRQVDAEQDRSIRRANKQLQDLIRQGQMALAAPIRVDDGYDELWLRPR